MVRRDDASRGTRPASCSRPRRRSSPRRSEGRGQHAGVLEAEHVERSLSGLERKLSDEQERAVERDRDRRESDRTVEALAGTGKTTSAAALRELYERAGYRVIGAAPTGRAVRELKERAGIGESRTLDSWALKLAAEPTALSHADGRPGVATPPAVMIIDEAGMAHTRLSARVIHDALAAEVKVIAIGDSGQLSSVQAGGWLGALSRKLGSHELREVMRQRDPRERRLLAGVHRGEPDAYLELKTTAGSCACSPASSPGSTPRGRDRPVGRAGAEARRAGGGDDHPRQPAPRAPEPARATSGSRARRARGERRDRRPRVGGRGPGDRPAQDRGRDLDNGMRGNDRRSTRGRAGAARRRRRHPEGRRRVRRAAPRARVRADRARNAERHCRLGGRDRPAAGLLAQLVLHRALPRPRADRHLSVDEPTRGQQEREQIAPAREPPTDATRLAMGRRMRERDDEDLALEQLEQMGQQQTEGAATSASELRAQYYVAQEQLRALRPRLDDPMIKHAETLMKVRNTITGLEAQREQDRRPQLRRDRAAHKHRATTRERALSELREQEANLGEQVPEPSGVLQRASELHETQQRLLKETRELRDRTITEELAQHPAWLSQTLGPEPSSHLLHERWRRRPGVEYARHRIDQHITDPTIAIDHQAATHALVRSISDTRAALGLEAPGANQDRGLDI